MGRAAAVRAATKSKTDAKKAKTNAIFGKKIIMAVKQGGPDPEGNRALNDLMKAAKANSVPIDVRLFLLLDEFLFWSLIEFCVLVFVTELLHLYCLVFLIIYL